MSVWACVCMQTLFGSGLRPVDNVEGEAHPLLQKGISLLQALVQSLGLDAFHTHSGEQRANMYIVATSLPLRSSHLFQWLPHTLKAQWLYLLYRMAVAFYFLVWLLAIYINFSSPKVFILLTHWSFIALNLYFLSALAGTAVNFFLVYVHPRKKRVESPPDTEEEEDNRRCCRLTTWQDQATVCDKVTWALFIIAVESAFMVALLFWIFISGAVELSPAVNAHVHILNGVFALVEVWITGLPIHLLHFLYPLLFSVSYGVFTGVYYAVNGTGPTGESYIYPVLDYDSQPGAAIGTLSVALVACLMIHLLFHCQHLFRHWLTSHLQHRSKYYKRYFDPIDMSAPIPVPDYIAM